MPSLIISCLSQKGGVGKSTIARLVARTYAAAGWDVKIADFNTTQLTSVKWANVRAAVKQKPHIAAQPFNSPTAMKRDAADLIVADGRPDSDQTSLDIARISSLVLVPTGLSLDDLEPQLMFANELIEKGIAQDRILFVLNKTTDSAVAVAEARGYLDSFRVATQDLGAKTSYQRAQNHGLALSEVGSKVGKLEERADLLAAEIVAYINEIEEETV
jgi:chromosome partitioning protein